MKKRRIRKKDLQAKLDSNNKRLDTAIGMINAITKHLDVQLYPVGGWKAVPMEKKEVKF